MGSENPQPLRETANVRLTGKIVGWILRVNHEPMSTLVGMMVDGMVCVLA